MANNHDVGIAIQGFYKLEELRKSPGFPSMERFEKGPVAVLECTQKIPCDPCEKACPKGSITIGQNIINLPELNDGICNGCGVCIPACPGLAIFVVHKNFSKTTTLLEIPYEYYPLPPKGGKVTCVNRKGQPVTTGIVRNVKTYKKNDLTAVLAIEIPKNFCLEVRSIMNQEDEN